MSFTTSTTTGADSTTVKREDDSTTLNGTSHQGDPFYPMVNIAEHIEDSKRVLKDPPLISALKWIVIFDEKTSSAEDELTSTIISKINLESILGVAGVKPQNVHFTLVKLLLSLQVSSSMTPDARGGLFKLPLGYDAVRLSTSISRQWATSQLEKLTNHDRVRFSKVHAVSQQHTTTTTAAPPQLLLAVSSNHFSTACVETVTKELKGEFIAEDIGGRLEAAWLIVEGHHWPARPRLVRSSMKEEEGSLPKNKGVKLEKSTPPIILLCGGTSGCGKSTLSAMVSSRLGIKNVISTDTIRELLRKEIGSSAGGTEEFPELFTSTYKGHEVELSEGSLKALQEEQAFLLSRPLANKAGTVSSALCKGGGKSVTYVGDNFHHHQSCVVSTPNSSFVGGGITSEAGTSTAIGGGGQTPTSLACGPRATPTSSGVNGGMPASPPAQAPGLFPDEEPFTSREGSASTILPPPLLSGSKKVSYTERLIATYIAQCRLVLKVVDRVISSAIARGQSTLIEGVHLLPSYMVETALSLSRSKSSGDGPSALVVPLLIYMRKEGKHKERLAVRGKAMSLTPAGNPYLQHFDGIRIIQSYLLEQVQDSKLFLVSNTNVDRSVNRIHNYTLHTVQHLNTCDKNVFVLHKESDIDDYGAVERAAGADTSSRTTALSLFTNCGVWTTKVSSYDTKQALEKIKKKKEEKLLRKKPATTPAPSQPLLKELRDGTHASQAASPTKSLFTDEECGSVVAPSELSEEDVALRRKLL